MNDDKIKLTTKQAVSLLADQEEIHTFRQGGMNVLIGADWSKQTLVEAMLEYSDTLEIGGEHCRAMGHGLVFKDEHGHVFVEVDKDKLKTLEQQINENNRK